MTKETNPGKLDQLVAGGISTTPLDTIHKECFEEAGLEGNLLTNLKLADKVSRWTRGKLQVKAATNYVYDLELQPEFNPVNMDNEVESFHLLSVEEATERLGEFKPDAQLVMINFLKRFGYIDCNADMVQVFPFPEPIWD